MTRWLFALILLAAPACADDTDFVKVTSSGSVVFDTRTNAWSRVELPELPETCDIVRDCVVQVCERECRCLRFREDCAVYPAGWAFD